MTESLGMIQGLPSNPTFCAPLYNFRNYNNMWKKLGDAF